MQPPCCVARLLQLSSIASKLEIGTVRRDPTQSTRAVRGDEHHALQWEGQWNTSKGSEQSVLRQGWVLGSSDMKRTYTET
jgi:hypothetical protein